MEFNEKLQQLRKNKGLTQEELAQAIYVSRTAVSKWESGRGLSVISCLLFIITRQPYAGVFCFFIFIIKGWLIFRRKA